ncbi:dihydroneopterin aldolase [uncultured Amaricoccus sp.]|uniref:dihydroneopterin aldolase n=2 Tax=Amaricoccus TaxID=56999 RepID=UPI0026272DC1|nr:dihydroneopterin aldolase [uncultured Amaricoccus sp.]
MDETAMAFEMPHVRAAATQTGQLLDRISVRDYTRTVEIGAFRSERGVTQRIRFNVVMEVSHHTAAQDDDVDKVVSYDSITEAIEAEFASERVNLLETLAERVAARCLADPRAVRVFVRIEKLDRIPGALGVEIARARVAGAPRLRPVVEPVAAAAARARVFHLAQSLLEGPEADAWLDALVGWEHPVVLVLGPAEPRAPGRTEAERRIGLLAIEQNAWALTDRDPRFDVAASRTELDWAMKNRRPTVWAPAKMVMDAPGAAAPDAGDPVALAAWLAAEIEAELLVIAGTEAPPGASRVERPSDLPA